MKFTQDTEETGPVTNICVEEFSTVNLWCNVTGSPVPVVKWFMETQDGQQYDLGIKGKRLQIRNITRDCSSHKSYICNATNGETSISRTFQIMTKYKPFVDISVESSDRALQTMIDFQQSGKDYFPLHQNMGDMVTLVCNVESFPFGNTSWMLNDTWIVNHTSEMAEPEINRNHALNYVFGSIESPSFKVVNSHEQQLKLHFKIADGLEFGQYKCCSRNEYGEDCWTVYLQKM